MISKAADYRREALLGFHGYHVRACRRGPDGEQATVSAKVDDPSAPRHCQAGA